MSVLEIPLKSVRQALSDAHDTFVGDEGQAVVEETARLTSRGNVQPYFVPAVKFLLDASFKVFSDPFIQEQMDNEVATRADVAATLARVIGKHASRQRTLFELYQNSDTLRALNISDSDKDALKHRKYMSSLVASPFSDAGHVLGGAVRILRKAGHEEVVAPALASTGLLVVAATHKGHVPAVREYLGSRYVKENNLRIEDGDQDICPKVEFTDAAKSLILMFAQKDRGCPAARINASVERPNLLKEYWPKFVAALVTPDATANLRT